MIRVEVVLPHVVQDFQIIDRASDQLLEILLLNETILTPDVMVDMDAGTTTVDLLLATNDGNEAIQLAFAALHLAQLTMTSAPDALDLYDQASRQATAELVPA